MLSEIYKAFNLKQYNNCICMINQYLESDIEKSNLSEFYYLLGQCFFELKDYSSSKKAFFESIRLSESKKYSFSGSGNYMSKLMLARIYSLEMDVSNAVKAYIEAVFDVNNYRRIGADEAIQFLKIHQINDVLNELLSLIQADGLSAGIIKSFKLLQELYMDYPKEIHIETTGRCNASCDFCPHSELDRKNSEMPDELFKKIVHDLKMIPSSVKFHISPFKVNEPLMDKNFFKKIELINQELPTAFIRFFSNFNMADSFTPTKIARIKNLSSICISLNSLDHEEYFQAMGLRLEKTVSNIKCLFEFNKQNKFIDEITILRVGDGTSKDVNFISAVKEVFSEYEDQFRVSVLARGEWISHIKGAEKRHQSNPCLRWYEISITCTGKVAFCCMDGKCEYPIGDAWDQNVLDIYNNPVYRGYRINGYERRNVSPCNKCSYD